MSRHTQGAPHRATALCAPKGLIPDGGAMKPRRMGLRTPGEPLACRAGHEIDEHHWLTDGASAFPCRRSGCTWAVYVVRGGGTLDFRADLTHAEALEIRRRRLSAEAVADYLGARLAEAG